jgi:hypothetical protein
MSQDELPIFVKWMDFLNWLLPTTEKFPKRVRFVFVERINNLALDVIEDIIEARYSRFEKPVLKQLNLKLEKLRVLLRICQSQSYLSHKSYHYAVKKIDEVGRMAGGWLKQS